MSHPVYIDTHIGGVLKNFFSTHRYSKAVVVVDENTYKHCYPLVADVLLPHSLIRIRSGEEHKHLQTCTQLWQKMTDYKLDRKAICINLGGGVIGDMAGFCAATYKRGIDFIQIPTTLLSQVDASVGGKLGVDFQGFKNHIGVFKDPVAVFVSPEFLQTLPFLEVRSGFAEIIKHCLIADENMWHTIRSKDFEEQDWVQLIAHSIEIKKNVVAQDPTEKGLRKILNFGHTIGHAVETHFLSIPKRKLLHGEAIAIGMICEAYLSYRRKLLSEESLMQIEEFIFSTYGRIKITDEDIQSIIPLALQDKKNANGKIQCVLLEKIGQPIIDQVITPKEIRQSLHYYQ